MPMHRRGLLAVSAVALFGGRMSTMAAPSIPPERGSDSPADGPVVVSGNVIFPANLPPGPAAPITVTIQDVSRMDAPAVTLASATIPVSSPPTPGQAVPFSIPVGAYDSRMTYSVRAHVDRDGDGSVSSGDLVSTTSNPVLTRGAGTVVSVPLTVVG